MKKIDTYIEEKLVISKDVKVLKHKHKRKTKINKGNSDYIAWVNTIGPVSSTTGKYEDICIFDEEHKDKYIYFLGIRTNDVIARVDYCLIGHEPVLNIGDKLCLYDNDTQRKRSRPGVNKIVDIIRCRKSDFDSFMKKNNYFTDYSYKTGYRSSHKLKYDKFNNYYYYLVGIEK